MFRHISVFVLKRPLAADDLAHVARCLAEANAACDTAVGGEVGVSLALQDGPDAPVPPLPEGAPQFGDVVQIIDFATREDLDAYPMHPAHQALRAQTDALIECVFAIDYEIAG